MSQTPNHGYNVPSKGDPNWHKPLNENFRQYDTDIEIRDTEANRGNYQPAQGAKFLATDTGAIYFGDGSSWNRLLPSGEDSIFGEIQADRLGLGRTPVSKNRLTVRSSSGDGAAIDARTSSSENTATGVYAEASSSSGNTFGTYSASRSPDGHGVFGVNFASSGQAIGVEGRAESPQGVGVQALNRNGLAFKAVGNSELRGDLEITERLGVGVEPNSQDRIRAKQESGQGATLNAETSSSENTATGVYAEASSSSGNTFGTYSVSRSPEGHGVFGVNFAESGGAIGVEGRNFSPDGVGVQALNRNGLAFKAVGDCEIRGDLQVSGQKNFAQTVEAEGGEKEVVYTATEAGTPRTEASGVAELDDGRVEIDLPEHFAWVTDDDAPLVVQTTPYGGSAGLKIVERSTERLVVEDLDGEGGYEFAYTVKGTREGYADTEVVRDTDENGHSEVSTSDRASGEDPASGAENELW